MLQKILGKIYICSIILLIGISAKAADFEKEIRVDYRLQLADNKVSVTETRIVRNKTANLVIKEDNNESFTINAINKDQLLFANSLASVSVTVDGQSRTLTKNQGENQSEILVRYGKSVKPGKEITFVLQYDNLTLLRKSGALLDFYAPGLARGFNSDTTKTSISYRANVYVPDSFPEINLALPSPLEQKTEGNSKVYVYDDAKLINEMIWLQFGKQQFFKFNISQEIPALNQENVGVVNQYKLIIPRDYEGYKTTQKVYFTSLNPMPVAVEEDLEQNLLATFEFPSHVAGKISIAGYASVTIGNNTVSAANSGSKADYVFSNLDNTMYLLAAKYWESDSAAIMQQAEQLAGSEQNVYEILKKDYQFLVSRINYDTVKRFGINERQGALQTLEKGSGVCMEYSDLFVALARAQSIPSRAGFGYGYDNSVFSVITDAHQWAEVRLPHADKWVAVDVTWGLNGDVLIGGDLNHFYTHVTGRNPLDPADVSVNYATIDNSQNQMQLQPPRVEVSVADSGGSSIYDAQALLEEFKNNTAGDIITDKWAYYTYRIRSLWDSFSKSPLAVPTLLVVGIVLLSLAGNGIYRMLRYRKY